MVSFVYGDSYRIFINTALGCEGGCQYCYLSKLGVSEERLEKSVEEILEILNEMEEYRPGRTGTILSLGCYSECLDAKNKKKTTELIRLLAKKGNYIQFATKKEITVEELLEIDSLATFPNQIGVYLSVPTISESRILEPGTDDVGLRLSPLEYAQELKNIYFVLYIKPVIPNITKKDVELYRRMMERYQIPAIIGPMLDLKGDETSVLVGEDKLAEQESEDLEFLDRALSESGKTYRHSTEIIDELQKEWWE